MFHVPNQYRFTKMHYSDELDGNNGQFVFPSIEGQRRLFAQASDGLGWEHVSISAFVSIRGKRGKPGRRITFTPTWAEMCYVKSLFWDDDDVVIQFHPAKSEYVNNAEHCLHLWRPTDAQVPTPASLLVGWRNEKEKAELLQLHA